MHDTGGSNLLSFRGSLKRDAISVRTARYFAFPSLSIEGPPLAVQEAMAGGMAVITTETCGMVDLIENDYNGLLVKPADTAAFVAATERLIHSAELRERLGRAAQETMKRHTWDRVAEQLEGIFKAATP